MIEAERTVAGVTPLPADDDGRISLRLRVNGRDERVKARAHHTLLDVLRNELGLTGPREGCGVGMCGACTVLVDGRPVSGCLLPAALAEGYELTTIEGLEGPNGELHPIQQAFVDHTGFQCSYCTPGFILTAKALLDEQPNATREQATQYLAGNLCRCGSYVKILDSVEAARDRLIGG
jgi:carbon-monoxide dehydrogenase small subunit/isoquinoline 1-oxidoreductase alpha subunit/xanthine dehydrogenase YagT iron-sulfur-binding subunit